MTSVSTMFTLCVLCAMAAASHAFIDVTNDSGYCNWQRAEHFSECRKLSPRWKQLACEKVHQAICVDRDVLLKLTCIAAAEVTYRTEPWPRKYYEASVAKCPNGVLPAALKCATDGRDHFVLCLPGVNLLYPCREYLTQACGIPSENFTLKDVVACYDQCAENVRGHGRALEDCKLTCRHTTRPRL